MSAGVPKVLVDANILYPRTLRDWVMLMSLRSGHPLFHVRWTEDVLVETLFHLRKDHPFWDDAQVGGIRDKIVGSAPNGRITGYRVDETLEYRDKHDAHLHAAAEHGGVTYVVSNDKDFASFAAENDDILNYEVYSADEFFLWIDQNSPPTVVEAIIKQLKYFRGKGEQFNLVTALQGAQAPGFAERVREYLKSSPAVEKLLSEPPPKKRTRSTV